MKFRLLTILCSMLFTLMASAQASGGQIRRPQKVQHHKQRNDNSKISSSKNYNIISDRTQSTNCDNNHSASFAYEDVELNSSDSPNMAKKLTANGPQQVLVGEEFLLTYTINSQEDVSEFHLGQIPSAFDLLIGPNRSARADGESGSFIYSYIIRALKSGSFTIPSATIYVKGQKVKSNVVMIKVYKTSQ